MELNQIWDNYKDEVYFFILKQVKNEDAANEVLQNSFLKVCLYLDSLKEQNKVRAWIFQITRNEIINHFNESSKPTKTELPNLEEEQEIDDDICCLDRFVEQLPDTYRETIELLYFQGKKQHEVAEILDISLANVKARVRRGKAMLKQDLQECCQYELNKDGDLVGESDCAHCEA